MADKCKKCNCDIVQLKEALKCSECASLFHPQCVCPPGGEKKISTRKNWKCELCVAETSSTSSRASESQTVLDAIAAFRKESNTRWDENNAKLDTLRVDISKVRADVNDLKTLYNNLKSETNKNSEDVEKLFNLNSELSVAVKVLKREVADLQQHTRKNNIIISGIPVTPREDLFSIINSIARVLDIDYHGEHISAAHRLPSQLTDRPPSIVVSFVSRAVKMGWLQARRTRRTLLAKELSSVFPDQQVYLNDHLSKDNRDLFNDARKLVREGKLAAVWTSDCRILGKHTPTGRPFRINDHHQLQEARRKPNA